MGNELKPCPFCGRPASIRGDFGLQQLACSDPAGECPGSQVGLPAHRPAHRAASIAAWNRRALSSSASEPVGEPVAGRIREAAYDQIDRFLRNNLDDSDYADYSQALDLIYTTVSPLPQEPREAELTDELALHLWDIHVAYETGASAKQPPLTDKDKLAFARAIERELRGAQEVKAGEEVEFVIENDGGFLASAYGPREAAHGEIQRYASQYVEEGPLTIYEVTRKKVATIDADSQGEKG